MIEWQPIETAPQAGTKVLLWLPGQDPVTAFFYMPLSNPSRGRWTNGLEEFEDPTHWAPINVPKAKP